MCNQQLSLLEHCRRCGAKCCIGGESFGSPIISEDEKRAIRKFTDKGCFQKVISPTNQAYYVIEEPTKERRCVFLSENNECLIQPVKPWDCRCYPLKALYKRKRQITILDVSPEKAKEKAQPLILSPLNWNSLSKPPEEIYISDRIKIIVDSQCPAIRDLSSEFLKAALKVAVMSISRFDRITYQHWLDNYIGRLKGAIRLNEWFTSFET